MNGFGQTVYNFIFIKLCHLPRDASLCGIIQLTDIAALHLRTISHYTASFHSRQSSTCVFQFATLLKKVSLPPSLRFGDSSTNKYCKLRLQYLSFTAILSSTYRHRHRFFLHQKIPGRRVHGRGFCLLLFPESIRGTIHEP